MSAHDQLYDTAEDRQWLCETALKGYDLSPSQFGSFTIAGNEDCPTEIRLYRATSPLVTDEPISEYHLRASVPDSTFGDYMIVWPWNSTKR